MNTKEGSTNGAYLIFVRSRVTDSDYIICENKVLPSAVIDKIIILLWNVVYKVMTVYILVFIIRIETTTILKPLTARWATQSYRKTVSNKTESYKMYSVKKYFILCPLRS